MHGGVGMQCEEKPSTFFTPFPKPDDSTKKITACKQAKTLLHWSFMVTCRPPFVRPFRMSQSVYHMKLFTAENNTTIF
jgi:hypothetical protein